MDAESAQRYPMHAKLDSIPQNDRDAISCFLKWLGDQGYTICEWREAGNNGEPPMVPATEEYLDTVEEKYGMGVRLHVRKFGMPNPAHESWAADYYHVGNDPTRWLERYYGIDRQKLSEEIDAMLARYRETKSI
jgi:hypothetical protein